MQFFDELFQLLKFILNLYEIYQQGLSKVIILKRSIYVAMRSACRRASST